MRHSRLARILRPDALRERIQTVHTERFDQALQRFVERLMNGADIRQ
jgi:hypothetical protein